MTRPATCENPASRIYWQRSASSPNRRIAFALALVLGCVAALAGGAPEGAIAG